MEIELLLRKIENKDWATLIFVLVLGLIAYNRWIFTSQFSDFSKLIFSNKYIKIYRDPSQLSSWFTLSMAFVQFITFSFIIHIFLSYFSTTNLASFRQFAQILNIVCFFILSKYLIEKVIAICFDLEEFINQFHLVKVNYRTYLGLAMLPITMILFYNTTISPYVMYLILSLIVIANVFIYSMIIKIHQKQLSSYFYYFILYLCTFEIAPYYILYKWYVNSGI